MSTAIRPHGVMALPTDHILAEMREACTEHEWAVIHNDGTWTGPYPDQDTAVGVAFPTG